MAKKEKNCDPTNPADDRKGDCWDYVALDPEHRLVVSVVPGERTAENAQAVVDDFKRRTGGRVMNLMTSDGFPAYETAILEAYGETVTPPRTGKRGRPKAPYKVPPKGLNYAVVEKTREKGRVVSVVTTRRSSSGRTPRTGTATPGRRGRRTGSARTGRSMKR